MACFLEVKATPSLEWMNLSQSATCKQSLLVRCGYHEIRGTQVGAEYFLFSFRVIGVLDPSALTAEGRKFVHIHKGNFMFRA